jgi:transcriptional regulator with XRE-family HTH domain
MVDLVTEALKERIKERMEKLGKNPSSVALDAGLSRSAVRDILSGKAKNPGIITIHQIADALECSYNYLMGWDDEIHYRESRDILIDVSARTSEISGVLEAGIFKQIPDETPPWHGDPFTETEPSKFGRRERKPFRSKRRYIHRDLYLYRVGDSSLDEYNVAKGDLIVAVFDPERMELRPGALVIVSHRLHGINVEELSARIVSKNGNSFTLRAASSQTVYAPIELGDRTDEPATFHTLAGGKVFIEGIAVELTRQLDV